MSRQYRRNADENLRDLERRFRAGDVTVFPQLVALKVRTRNLTIDFLLEFPQVFYHLPPEMQEALSAMGHGPEESSATTEDYCLECRIPEHSVCSMTSGCPCCEDTAEHMGISLETEPASYAFEEEEEEDEHAAEREAGEFWECASCGDELFESDKDETWALLTEASAAVTTSQLGRGEENQAMCEDCLNQAGLDLEQAASDELYEFCPNCGESIEDCVCEED